MVHESCTADTRDHEDHTFCGVMFDVRCASRLPLDYIEIDSLWVRGHLGPMTVWRTDDTFAHKHESKAMWTCIFERDVPASPLELVELKLDKPVRLDNGQSVGLYVHSGMPGDRGLVYDNQRAHVTHEDAAMALLPGLAHLSNRPFGRHGMWGRPWRQHREFVGRVSYGVRWLMWKPVVHHQFPPNFKKVVQTMMMASRRPESPVYLLQDEVVLFILNKCMWNDFGLDSTEAGSSTRLMAAAAAGQLLRTAGQYFARLAGAGEPSGSGEAGGSVARSGGPQSELRGLLEALRARAQSHAGLDVAFFGGAQDGDDEEEDDEEESGDLSDGGEYSPDSDDDDDGDDDDDDDDDDDNESDDDGPSIDEPSEGAGADSNIDDAAKANSACASDAEELSA